MKWNTAGAHLGKCPREEDGEHSYQVCSWCCGEAGMSGLPSRKIWAGEVAWWKLHAIQQAHKQSSAPENKVPSLQCYMLGLAVHGLLCRQSPGGHGRGQPHKSSMIPAAVGANSWNRSTGTPSREMISSSAQYSLDHIWITEASLGTFSTRQAVTDPSFQLRAAKAARGWSTCPVRRDWESKICSAWGRDFFRVT